MRRLPSELIHAVRVLTARPILTATMVLTLAVGIGGTSAMFSIASGLLLRPLPVPHPDRLVRVFGGTDQNPLGITSFPNLTDVASRTQSFQSMTIHQQTFAAYGLGEDTTNAAVELVSGTYFSTMGITPAQGRALAGADDVAGAAVRAAVVSDRWWRSRLNADPSVLGRQVRLNGAMFTVVGVAPASFHGSYDAVRTDLWVPLMTYDVVRPRGLDALQRSWGWLQATARLEDGVALESARAEVQTIGLALRAQYPSENNGLAMTIVPASAVPEGLAPVLGRVLVFAMIVAALALLAACANVANACLAAVSDRSAEIAVRMALGASRVDVARQWLVESLVVSGAATGLGLLLALWMRDAFLALRPLANLDNLSPVATIDWRVGACAAALMTLTTCLSGLLPALRASSVDPARPIREGTPTTVGARSSWASAGLVSAQAAVSLALLAVSGLLGQSMSAVRGFDLGFDTSHLVVARAIVNGLGHDDARSYAYHADTMARVRALPGVRAATAAAVVPLGSNDEQRGIAIPGYVPPDGAKSFGVANNVVWPGYFDVMGIPLRGGRGFDEHDGRPDAPVVAVVSETMARRYWPGGDPLGRVIDLGDGRTANVVGIVRDISYNTPGESPLPFLYLPYGPVSYIDGLTFHVRTSVDGATMARQMSGEIRRLDSRARVGDAMAYEELRASSLFPARAMAALSTGFGALALLLLLVGTYGVTAHVVAGRRREFALRMALGADPMSLRAAIVRRAIMWGLPGSVLGLVVAGLLGQLLRRFLFGVATTDPLSFGVAALVVVGTAALAAYLPARRVARAELATQLRT